MVEFGIHFFILNWFKEYLAGLPDLPIKTERVLSGHFQRDITEIIKSGSFLFTKRHFLWEEEPWGKYFYLPKFITAETLRDATNFDI